MKTSGHTVLISGGASGIGLALTERFVNNGNKVIVVSRNENKLKELESTSPQIATYACDLRSEEEMTRMVNWLYAEHPQLSVLIHNAGIQHNYSLLNAVNDGSYQWIEDEITLNLISPVQLTAQLLPLLIRHDEAAIVNVSSGLAIVPKTTAPVYCATKAALHSFTQSLRYQLEASPVRVFEILPPVVDTEMTKGRNMSKISPEKVADQFWNFYRTDRLEVPIGKVKWLQYLYRLSPVYAASLLKNS